MKQTAVEWLEDNIERDMNYLEILYLIKQAKEMEKEQIKKAFMEWYDGTTSYDAAEQYYNETFKSEL